MPLRVCIPTAGTGSRLGALTRYLNKSLIAVANKPVLAHQIDMFPPDTEFVITLGCKGDLVREFLSLAYPERKFHFAEVHPYEGEGSGLGLSLLACREYLNQPFIFMSCDTLVHGEIPAPDHNWMGYAEVADPAQYRTLRTGQGKVADIVEKAAASKTENKAYIGLAGIANPEVFWNAMARGGMDAVLTGEAYGMRALLAEGITARAYDWFDTGNPEALAASRIALAQPDAPNILEKPDEALWFVGSQVIKFSRDEKFVRNRVQRANLLGKYVPQVTGSTAHMYSYAKCQGDVLSAVITIPMFEALLEYSQEFWKSGAQQSDPGFRAECMKFYRDKTYARVEKFYKTYAHKDDAGLINGIKMPSLQSMLDGLDWNGLADGLAGRFHGDFHFENILWSEADRRFVFLDWRQDFGGSLSTGDVYYDLAKLMHGLIVCHALIAKDLYTASWSDGQLNYDFHRKQILVECERYFARWLEANGYDVRKVYTLTALIYLNIAGLHHYPYCLLLYGLGKYMLSRYSGTSNAAV